MLMRVRAPVIGKREGRESHVLARIANFGTVRVAAEDFEADHFERVRCGDVLEFLLSKSADRPPRPIKVKIIDAERWSIRERVDAYDE